MKTSSIKLTLEIRYWSSIIFFICVCIYGYMLIYLYGNEGIKSRYGVYILLLHTILVLCFMIVSSGVIKYADPINFINQKRYICVVVLEGIQYILAAILAKNNNIVDKQYAAIGYVVISTIIFGAICACHLKSINQYEIILENEGISRIVSEFEGAVKRGEDVDIEKNFKGFIQFMCYMIGMTVFYKYTLHSWILTGLFAILNSYALWKFHWNGIKKMMKYSKCYFGMVVVTATVAIFLLKIVFDGILPVSIMENRDEQEYLMVLVLFFLPLVGYGKRLSAAYSTSKYKWIK